MSSKRHIVTLKYPNTADSLLAFYWADIFFLFNFSRLDSGIKYLTSAFSAETVGRRQILTYKDGTEKIKIFIMVLDPAIT